MGKPAPALCDYFWMFFLPVVTSSQYVIQIKSYGSRLFFSLVYQMMQNTRCLTSADGRDVTKWLNISNHWVEHPADRFSTLLTMIGQLPGCLSRVGIGLFNGVAPDMMQTFMENLFGFFVRTPHCYHMTTVQRLAVRQCERMTRAVNLLSNSLQLVVLRGAS